MGTGLSDIPGNLRTDDGNLSDEGSTLAAQNTAGFRSLQALLGGGLGSANLQLEIKTVKLNHGIATNVRLNKLDRARGAYVLSVGSPDGKTRHSLSRPIDLIGSSRSGNVKLQASFMDPTATNVPVTVALTPDGNSSALPVRGIAAWTPLTLINGWSVFGGGFITPSYMKDPFGFVHLRGLLLNSAGQGVNIACALLPTGFTPAGPSSVHPNYSDVGPCRCDVGRGAGFNEIWPSVNIVVAAGGFRSLDGIIFDTRP